MSPQSLHILIATTDRLLREEVEAALAALRDVRPVVHFATDYRLAAETARSWRPALALVEMHEDQTPARTLTREIRAGSPETSIVGVFRPQIFGADISESMVLIESLRCGMQDFLRRPVSSTEMGDLLNRLATQENRRPISQGRVISFVSNKGGVGKSTLAVNVACELARRHPERVLLVDASLQMGVCASLLDLHPAMSMVDAARQRDRLDETLLRQLTVPHPCGLHLLAAPANALEGADVDDEVVARVLSLARRAYDYVVVDTFPMLDRVVMAVLDTSDRTFVVLDNMVPTVQSVARLLPLFDSLGVVRERRQLVLNRYLTSSGSPLAADVARRLGCDVDYVLPYDRRVITATNMGRPCMLKPAMFSAFCRGVRRIVAGIEQLNPSSAIPATSENGQRSSPVGAQAEGLSGEG